MGDSGVRRSIVTELSSQFPDLYTDDNIAFVGTHSHAGVGGYLENLLPQITSLGIVKQTSDAIIEGTVLAVQRAHASLALGKLSLGNTTILDANINRSPTAYLANPADERARYRYDVDKDMTVLRFDDLNGNARGLLSFFPVHGTSLYEVGHLDLYPRTWVVTRIIQNNTLVSTDNKGMAAYLYEGMMVTLCSEEYLVSFLRELASVEPTALPGTTSFIAGFVQCVFVQVLYIRTFIYGI